MPFISALFRTSSATICLLLCAGLPVRAAERVPSALENQRSPETVLYRFQGSADGALPVASVLADGTGGFFGTTQSGGGGACSGGCGTVFHLILGPNGYVERVVHRFSAPSDGTNPAAGLVKDAAGALYGTTADGGSGCGHPGCGVVFKLTPQAAGAYRESILYAFTGGADGGNPAADLLLDARGDLVGTTSSGGSGAGVVFELTLAPCSSASGDRPYRQSVLHAFARKGLDGTGPSGALVADAEGTLYGLTANGGTAGDGTVYALTPGKTGWAETILYSFRGGAGGASPGGALAFGPHGDLYGTAYLGGRNDAGLVFSLSRRGNGAFGEATIYEFATVGAEPAAGVYVDRAGILYGTTAFSGSPACYDFGACGIVFALTPAGKGFSYSIMHVFGGGRDGSEPLARLIPGPDGALFGTTLRGGSGNDGTVFSIR